MEPLFQTETEYTYERYAEYCRTIYGKLQHMGMKIMAVEIGMVLLAVFGFLRGDVSTAAIFLLAAMLFPLVYRWRMQKSIKKAWESNHAAQGTISRYGFFQDHVEVTNELGKSHAEYRKLYRVLETDHAFYLMLGSTQGMIVDKDRCSEELCRFIRGLEAQIGV